MKAHIITIGDELLIGQTINTNAAFIGKLLSEHQVNAAKITMIGDDLAGIIKEFTDSWKSFDLIICTGGLGPTHDDITRTAVSQFFNSPLHTDPEVLNDIVLRFQRLNRPLTKVNEEQALVPEIAMAIKNTLGTAPGNWIEKDNKIFVSLPGVPFEMEQMMINFVIPQLQSRLIDLPHYTVKTTLMTSGIAESTLFNLLGDIDELLQGGKLAFLPSPELGVRMRITVKDRTKELAEIKMHELEQRIRALAGRYIYGRDDENIAEVVGRLLADRNLTIAVAESCTGGDLCGSITDISGSSQYFERGVISYSNAAKVEILNVNEDTIAKYGAVSFEVARQMAEGVRAISGTDIGVSITGILGPTGARPNKPIGLVYIGYCDASICTAVKFQFGDNRIVNKKRATLAAFTLIRRAILGIPFDE